MPVTFGSVGDIISVCQLVAQAVKALSTSHGATACYNELMHELWSLTQALETVQDVIKENKTFVGTDGLEAVLDQCRQCLIVRLKGIQKYANHLSPNKRTVVDAFWKLRFQSHEGDISRLRETLATYTASINILLAKAGMDLNLGYYETTQAQINVFSTQLHKKLDFNRVCSVQHQTITQQLIAMNTKTLDGNQNLLLQLEASCSENAVSLSQVHKTLLSRLHDNTPSVSDIKDIREALSRLESKIVSSHIPQGLEKTWTQPPLIFEDAIGRVFPVHLEFIRSWDAFNYVLASHFKGVPGQHRIERGEYVIRDAKSRRAINQDAAWELGFKPGAKADMSVVFNNIKLPHNKCPGCYASNDDGSVTEAECAACGLLYQRSHSLYGPGDRYDSLGSYIESLKLPRAEDEVRLFKRVQVIAYLEQHENSAESFERNITHFLLSGAQSSRNQVSGNSRYVTGHRVAPV